MAWRRRPRRETSAVATLVSLVWVCCALTVVLLRRSQLGRAQRGEVETAWDFEDDLMGWGASSESYDMEVYVQGGEMRGRIIGAVPHIDSPPLVVDVAEGHSVAMRMMYAGKATNARLYYQSPEAGDAVYQDIDVKNDGQFYNYYVPITTKLTGKMTQLRLVIAQEREAVSGVSEASVGGSIGESAAIDYIRIVKAPIIQRVTGCIDQFAENINFDPLLSNIAESVELINGFLRTSTTQFFGMDDMPFAKTYNCVREGGQTITIEGLNFGDSGAVVTVDGEVCENVQHIAGREQLALTCVSPAGTGNPAIVRVSNGRLTGLFDERPYLSYAAAPASPNQPQVSNLGARSVDLSWTAPTNYFDSLAITGYQILFYDVSQGDDELQSLVVGNITTTTVKGLTPSTEYVFMVTALNENQSDPEWRTLDLYGRRSMLDGALVSPVSPPTGVEATLTSDVQFEKFDANSTLNHSGTDARTTVGPTGTIGGEGSYGLTLVGDANIENCNGSFLCCDEFNETSGTASCELYACSGIGRINQSPIINGVSGREVPHNLEGGEKVVLPWEEFAPLAPNIRCGPGIRLTSSAPRQSGSVWYPRPMNVRDGFDTTFSFRVSSPSTVCDVMEDVYSLCRSRGADGFAFVIQNDVNTALGAAGSGMGYEGINNSLAVEFDTYFNYDNLDAYENHISVQTRGWRARNSANHSYSLASSVRAPNLAEGEHTARIRYSPIFVDDDSMFPFFITTSWTTNFLQNADFPGGGMPDWGVGMGMLYVYVDNLNDPLFVTPLNLDATLALNNGKAWVGFTAATGETHYQVHDLQSWSFTQLYEDALYFRPPVVNLDGAYSCQNETLCVHP